MAACESACKDAQGQSLTCHLRQRLHWLASEPARPTTSASESQLVVQPQPAANEDSMPVDDSAPCRFPAPEDLETMMCDRGVERQSRPAPVRQVHHGVAPAASSATTHHGQPAAPSGSQVHHGVAFAASTSSIHRTQPPAVSAPSVYAPTQWLRNARTWMRRRRR